MHTCTLAGTLAYVRCEIHFEMCVRCVCVQHFFERAISDPTLAHLCTFFVEKMAILMLCLRRYKLVKV